MNKKLIAPIVTAAAMLATSIGSTFALFTSKASSKIELNSGVVDVSSNLSIDSVFELGNVSVSPDADGVYSDSISSKTYINPENPSSIVLERWAPGDKAILNIEVANNSNITIKTRFRESHSSDSTPDLYDAINISYTAKDADNNDISYKFMDWFVVEPTVSTIANIQVTIEFPDTDGGLVKFGDENNDNKYQNTNCEIMFVQEAVQGNAHVLSLLEELNLALDKARAVDGPNHYLTEALEDVGTIASLPVINAAGYVYDVINDQFCYPEEATGDLYNYFKIYDEMPGTQTYSIFANNWENADSISLDGVGFDAGTTTGITSVSYTDSGAAKTVTIYTNSPFTTLTIDAPNDVVHHYGELSELNIIAIAGESYHEHGRVSYVELANGHVSLEEGSSVKHVHLDYNNDESKFDNLVISYDESVELPTFSRDVVPTIAENGTLVVKVQDLEEENVDYIWLYQQGLLEQIRVSDSATSAGNVKATDDSVSLETKEISDEIANNLSEGHTYEEVEKDADGKVVDETLIEQSGLTEAEKAENKAKVIEEGYDFIAYDPVNGTKIRDTKAFGYYSEGDLVMVKDAKVDILREGYDYTYNPDGDYINMWAIGGFEYGFDAEWNPCPEYVSIYDETLYNDGSGEWGSAKEAAEALPREQYPSLYFSRGEWNPELSPSSQSISIPMENDIIIDLNGHTITRYGCSGNSFEIKRDKTVTFKNGTLETATTANSFMYVGGSIDLGNHQTAITAGHLVIDNCTLINNQYLNDTGTSKGGFSNSFIGLRDGGSSIVATNCNFIHCGVTSTYASKAAVHSTSATFENCTFTRRTDAKVNTNVGSKIYVTDYRVGGSVTFYNVTIDAKSGSAAMYVLDLGTSSRTEANRLNFTFKDLTINFTGGASNKTIFTYLKNTTVNDLGGNHFYVDGVEKTFTVNESTGYVTWKNVETA